MDLQVLDCTLRDGGYCNEWNFGSENKKRIVSSLVNAKIDVVECGFVTNRVEYDNNTSKYTDFKSVDEDYAFLREKPKFVVMINYGEYELEKIPLSEDTTVDGIRVAFHKKKAKEAIDFCEGLKRKGYLVFVQPMVTLNYSDEEFFDLLELVNKLSPYAFYIVDSFGTMKNADLLHYFDLIKEKLDKSICIGFHSHNNIQSALSNAISFMNYGEKRHLIVDSSIYGMGRGAGNLNTELLLSEINGKCENRYLIKPLLKCMDDVIHKFYKEKPWGYSLPNYLSAVHMVHPNYAMYLSEKNTLTVEAIDDIFSKIEEDKAVEFDLEYIEKLYLEYMSRGQINEGRIEDIKKIISGRKILFISPGKTASTEKQRIKDFILKEKPVVVSVNHEDEDVAVDYVFISNMRRFKNLNEAAYCKTIVTSNIDTEHVHAIVSYYSLINSVQSVRDNSGLMAIRLFINLGADNIYLAGYDGYDYSTNNYENKEMALIMSEKQIASLNFGMKSVLDEYKKSCKISFLTPSRFE